MSVIIGIDPGLLSGAVGVIDQNGYRFCGAIKSVDGRVDAIDLKNTLKQAVDASEDAMICIEQVFGMRGQGISSTSKFMRAVGVIEAVCVLTRYPVHFVSPQKWKKHFGLIKCDKNASLDIARKLYPEATLSKKKDHNKAEALLLARYLFEMNI